MISVLSRSCIAANSVSVATRNTSAFGDRRIIYHVLRASALDQSIDPTHVRDRWFFEFSTGTALIEGAVVGERHLSARDTPEMGNQYLSGVFPFLKHASGDEIDADVVPLRFPFDQQGCTLDVRVDHEILHHVDLIVQVSWQRSLAVMQRLFIIDDRYVQCGSLQF